MTAIAIELPTPIRTYVRRFGMRRRRLRLARAAGRAAIFTLAWTLLCCGVDRLLALPPEVRLALLVINVGVVCAIMTDAALLLWRNVDWAAEARHIERHEPAFAQRLATIVSRLLGPRQHRGSAAMLDHLTAEVEAAARARNPAALLPAGTALRPWLIAASMSVAAILLGMPPIVGLPRLLKRYTMPLANAAAVSTTVLDLSPGGVEVIEGEPLLVRATAQRLGEGGLTIHVRRADGAWTAWPMRAGGDGAFEFTLSDVRADLEYFVSGGDASSDVYHAAVLLKPAVAEFRVRYTYPPYLGLPQRGTSGADGRIEAPIDSVADVTLEASERLSSATLILGADAIVMSPTRDAHTRQASISVQRDQRFDVRLVSDRGVEGLFHGGTIHAIPDRPPLLRIIQPPSDATVPAGGVLNVAFEAADDFAIESLVLSLRRGGRHSANTSREIAIPVSGDARQQRGVQRLDLAALRLKSGNSLRVQLRAYDGAGQRSTASVLVRVGRPSTIATDAPSAIIAVAPMTNPVSPTTAPAEPTADPPAYRDALDAYFRAIRANRADRADRAGSSTRRSGSAQN